MKNNIATIRKQKGITQKELAKKVGITAWWMNHIERGKRNPSLETMLNIAKELDVKVSDLFLE